MTEIIQALLSTFKSFLKPKILFYLFLPILLTLSVLAVLAVFFGGEFFQFLLKLIQGQWMQILPPWLLQFSQEVLIPFISFGMTLVIFFLSVPILYWFFIFLISIFLMPALLSLIQKSEYSDLRKLQSASFFKSLWHSLKTSGVFFLLLIISIPSWIVPGMSVVVPILLTAYLNHKIFTFDIYAEYATADERVLLENKSVWTSYILGIFLGFLCYIPFVSFIIPVFSATCYIHFHLLNLKKIRNQHLNRIKT